MAEPVRWGILSTANIGRRAVTPAIQRSRNGRAIAVASRDLPQAQAYAQELGIPQAYGSYEQLLADPAVEAVYIALPNSLHREWTERAAAAGKHILCEKPLALDAAECATMAAAADSHGVLLLEAFMYRFHPRTLRVLDLVRAGAIGTPRLLTASFSFNITNPANIRLQPELGGGALMDVGCYCVNAARTLFGAEPLEAQAYASWGPSGVETALAGTLRFSNDRLAQFDCALNLPRRERYELVGSAGVLDVSAAFLPGTADTPLNWRRGPETMTELIPGTDEYQLMVEHFADAVRHVAPLRYPVTEAAANMRAIAALLRSARNGGQPQPV